jgi:phospholipase D1/2
LLPEVDGGNRYCTSKEHHKDGLRQEARVRDVGDTILQTERKDFTMEGKERTGFASSEVQTAEEKTTAEERPYPSQADNLTSEQQRVNDSPANAEKYNELEGVEKDARTAHASRAQHEPDGPSSGSTIRKQQTSRFGTDSIHRPHVDPDGFEDPISDAFWKNVWVASAAYNVRRSASSYFMIVTLIAALRRRYTAKFSMLYLMTP